MGFKKIEFEYTERFLVMLEIGLADMYSNLINYYFEHIEPNKPYSEDYILDMSYYPIKCDVEEESVTLLVNGYIEVDD
jgi:hypothetical protein